MARYIGDPKYDTLFWLCLPIVLVYVTGKVALAWLKTKLPHAPAPLRRCQQCGWELAEERTSLLCGKCEWEQEHQPASVSKLFCCDVDLEYESTGRKSGYSPGTSVTTMITKTYRCPSCGRVWLYGEIWYSDRAREADWHPQRMEADGDGMLPPVNERTRTTVYPKPFKL